MKNTSQSISVELIKPVKQFPKLESNKKDKGFVVTQFPKGRFELGHYFHIASSRSGHNFVKDNIMSWVNHKENRPRRFYNMENYKPKHFQSDTEGKGIENYPHSITILQIRDLLNWYSSLVYFINRKPTNPSRYTEYYLDAWFEIAREYCGETNYLPNAINVSYEDFFLSKQYRRNVCSQIKGAEYNEDVINDVTVAGRGSSFDGLDYQGRASEMQVLDRYNQLPEEYQHWWKVLMKYPQIIELYLKYFKVTDEQKHFINNIKYL